MSPGTPSPPADCWHGECPRAGTTWLHAHTHGEGRRRHNAAVMLSHRVRSGGGGGGGGGGGLGNLPRLFGILESVSTHNGGGWGYGITSRGLPLL